jgi:hypothetical protein
MATSHVTKFSIPPARVLAFYPKGKAVEADQNDDRAYLAKQGIGGIERSDAECKHLAAALKFCDRATEWRTRNPNRSREEEHKAFSADVAAGRFPWAENLKSRPTVGASMSRGNSTPQPPTDAA